MAFGIGTTRKGLRGARRRAGRLLVQSLSLALIAPLLSGVSAATAAEKEGLGRPELPEPRVSKVKEVKGPGARKARERVAATRKANAAQADRGRAEQRGSWPKQGSADLTFAGDKPDTVKPGGMPVSVRPAQGKQSKAAENSRVSEARVTVLDQKAAAKAGIIGVLLTAEADASDSAEVDVDYSGFASAIGGNWAQRLRVVQLPPCALTTPQKTECRQQTPLPSDNDLAQQTVSAKVRLGRSAPGGTSTQLLDKAGSAASGATVLAVTAAPAGTGQSPKGAGDYSATQLSASSAWQAGGNSGAFTWSYDFTLPPVAAGPVPPLTLSYDSGSVDGRTATTNNQTTTVGEGFALTESYIERSYGSCDDDGHDDVFDHCWKYDNARLVLNGKSTRMVKDKDSGQWHLEDDDASQVKRSTGADNGDNDGEYWTVITGDGTKYVFGLHKLDGAADQRTNSTWTVPVFGDDSGEPGYSGGDAFAERSLTQAWRWNLDYVEDTRGNASTYWYTKESNYYKKNKATKASASYTRGGYLNRIQYGLRKGALFTDKADAKVDFSYQERCTASDCPSLTKDTAEKWPDVPFDAICSKDDDECNSAGPSFFIRKRLTGIDTSSYNATSSAYDPVDAWDLTGEYLDGGDIGDSSDQVLTLKSLKRTGKAGDTAVGLDPISFTYQMRPNRVDATDDILPLTRPRISTVTSETGAITAVTLSSPECKRGEVLSAAPDSNTRSCYPQYWHINGAEDASIDWFHKYRVLAVGAHDPAADNPAVEYAYDYSGAAWHYSDDPFVPKDERTWSDWRGYRQVTAFTGATAVTRSKTVSLFLQGMDGDKKKDGTTKSVTVDPLLDTDIDFSGMADSDRYAGRLRQQVTYNGSQPISSVLTNYTYKQTAAQVVPDAADHVAQWVRDTVTHTSTYLTASKSWRSHVATKRYDALGMEYALDDYGQKGLGGDETCTRTWYARNPDLGITSLVSRTRTVARECSITDTSLDLPTNSSTRGDVLADTGVVYDKAGATTWLATQKPTKGDATWTGRATGYTATAGGDGERLPSGWQTVATTTYDPLGRPLDVTDAVNHTTSTAYTPADAGPLTKTITTQHPTEFRTVSFLDPRRGQALRTYDYNSKKTEQNYDALGRLTDVWLPNRVRGSQAPNSKFAYHLDNAKPSWVSTSSLKKDGETYNTTYALYDSLLRPLQTQTLTPKGGRLLTDTRYDTRGLAYETYTDIFDTTSTPNGTYTRAEYGEAPAQSETLFDGAGRPTTSTLYTFGDKKWSTTTSYTGDSTATTAVEGGSAQRTITDIRGRTTEMRSYESTGPADIDFGGTSGAPYDTTPFTYALDGQPASITGPDGAKWAYIYDLFGRQKTVSDPDKGTTRTEYNTLDQVIKSTDSRGQSVLTDYDELGRPTATWAGSKTDANQLTARTYDTLLKGQPAASTRYIGGKTGAAYTKTVTQYDSLYNATGTKLQLPDSDPLVRAGVPATLEYSSDYNVDGTLNISKEPAVGGLSSEIIDHTYNGLGQLTALGGATGYLLATDYSPIGQPQQLTLGTANTEEHKKLYLAKRYETGTNRLTRSYVTDQTHPYMLQDLNYTYDQAGNVTAISDPTTLGGTSSADTQCFIYDGHQRLTEAWTPSSQKCTDTRSASALSGPAPYWTSYTYNKAGQRTSETQHTGSAATKTTYCYTGAQPHTLTGTTTKNDCASPERAYAYDTTGNTLRRPGKTTGAAQSLIWSEEGKLARLTEDAQSTDYLYDADGALLIRATKNGERVLYAGATELHLRADGTTWAQRYYGAGDLSVAVRTNESGKQKLSYLAGDHHGTSTLAIAATSDQTYTKRYTTPFGADRGKPAFGPWPDDKGFLGKTRDATTGLTHIGARQYDPAIGQFISVDPLLVPTDPDSLNGYSYAGNSPVTMSDPSGLMACATPVECGGGTQYGNNTPTKNSGGKSLNDPSWGCNGCDGDSYDDGAWSISGWSDWYSGTSGGTSSTSNTSPTPAPSPGPAPDPDLYTQAGINDPALNAIKLIYSVFGPDIGEWKACANDVGVNSHCGWAVADLPTPAKILKLAKLGKLKKGEDALGAATKCTKCFLAGTDVLMADGSTKDIEDVEVGDKVQATDPETGETGPREVTRLIVTKDDKHFNELSIATEDGIEKLTATHEHPFWSPTARDWVEAADLKPGMTLLTDDGDTVIVTANTAYTQHATTYNLTVSDLHTYYVLAGETPVLVHNSGPNCGVPTGGRNGDRLGGEDFHGSDYSLDEMVEFVNGHTGDGNPAMGRPSAAEIETTLRQAGPRQLDGQNSSRFDHNGVRVIVNWDMPWKSTAYYPGR
ncbi:polymorphic toxin-type HINT domain-containing protein [Streptomyces sp. NPDC002838]|uniref:polymorphic toxin-type HINT domain-containing protein n=1 Tax=Streptomyces sp. NPDC002838 TaxID=3154436 RepID=UPI00332A8ED6